MANGIRVTLADIEAALEGVCQIAVRTPSVPFEVEGRDVLLKLENLQRLGSFKIRGAWNRMTRLTPEERRRGVTTISSGNHGLAVAWASRKMGLGCIVRVPEGASERKVEAIRALGARVEPMSREEIVRTHWEEGWRGWSQTFIPPFADPAVIAGQGTVGWELAEDRPEIRSVLVPVGGGGLIAGVAVAIKGRLPGSKVYGVQAEGAASLSEAFRTKQAYRVERPETIADGIQIGIVLPTMVDLLVGKIDGCFLVSDDDIRLAMRRLALDAKIVAEPSGATAFAGWMRYGGSLEPPVAVVISGGNVDPRILSQVLM